MCTILIEKKKTTTTDADASMGYAKQNVKKASHRKTLSSVSCAFARFQFSFFCLCARVMNFVELATEPKGTPSQTQSDTSLQAFKLFAFAKQKKAKYFPKKNTKLIPLLCYALLL